MAVELIRPPFILRDLSEIMILAKLFRGLGDSLRLRLLDAIARRPRTVSELVGLAGAPQGRVSSHLACLRWCGFVVARRTGRRVYYRVADRRVRKLLRLARSFARAQHERIACCTIIDEEGGHGH